MLATHHILSGDLFNITKRLKEIDSGYFAAYCYNKKRFEVHNRFQRGGSFCLAVPYDRLDARTLELVRKTRAERAKEVLEEAERHNVELSKRALTYAKRAVEAETERFLSARYKSADRF